MEPINKERCFPIILLVMVGQSSLVYNSLQRKHQFKSTLKLKTYDGESLDLGNFAMNLETKVPTNDKILDLSEFHKNICWFGG
jgi:hypothetical protein